MAKLKRHPKYGSAEMIQGNCPICGRVGMNFQTTDGRMACDIEHLEQLCGEHVESFEKAGRKCPKCGADMFKVGGDRALVSAWCANCGKELLFPNKEEPEPEAEKGVA